MYISVVKSDLMLTLMKTICLQVVNAFLTILLCLHFSAVMPLLLAGLVEGAGTHYHEPALTGNK